MSHHIPLSKFTREVREKLRVFDQDGNGTVDEKELTIAADMYKASKDSAAFRGKLLTGVLATIVALVVVFGGVSYWVARC